MKAVLSPDSDMKRMIVPVTHSLLNGSRHAPGGGGSSVATLQRESLGAPLEADFARTRSHTQEHSAARQPAMDACPLSLATPRTCPFGGACHACPARIQKKLTINQPGDEYELEADRVADAVMRMADQTGPESRAGGRRIERDTASLGSGSRELASQDTSSAPPIVHEVLHTPGQPLDGETRAFMEPRFGCEFGQVRVHTDSRASESAQAVSARAYTVGHHVVLGERRPHGSTQALALMAHELAHVVQQSTAPTSTVPASPQTPSTDPAAIHARVTSGTRLQRLGNNPGCSPVQVSQIRQAIYNARGWVNRATARLDASPLEPRTLAALRSNFGPVHGVAANAALISGRLRTAYREMSTIPYSCAGAGDATCAAGNCGYAPFAGSHSVVICTNSTLASADPVFRAGCVLHESLHAAFSRFTVDEYSGWRGHSSSTATYPGVGTDPLLNADSYTTLAMDLSGR